MRTSVHFLFAVVAAVRMQALLFTVVAAGSWPAGSQAADAEELGAKSRAHAFQVAHGVHTDRSGALSERFDEADVVFTSPVHARFGMDLRGMGRRGRVLLARQIERL